VVALGGLGVAAYVFRCCLDYREHMLALKKSSRHTADVMRSINQSGGRPPAGG
jgi:hypothetical protein